MKSDENCSVVVALLKCMKNKKKRERKLVERSFDNFFCTFKVNAKQLLAFVKNKFYFNEFISNY